MKWLSFLRRQHDDSDFGRLDRYKLFRKAGRDLQVALAKQLPKVAVPECGKKLGLFKAGTLILNNDDELAVLYDYCIHHHRRSGKNVIERHLAQSPPPPDSVEMQLLSALVNSHFSLFRAEEIVPRFGARLLDLVHGNRFDLTDLSVSDSGTPGLILAGRLLCLSSLTMSSGTLIPVPERVFEERIRPVVQTFMKHRPEDDRAKFTPGQEASFAGQVLRIALHAAGEDNTFFNDIDH